MEYQVKETVVLGEVVTVYSPDGWRWFNCLQQLAKWKRQHDAADGDFSWKKIYSRRRKKKKIESSDDDF